MANPAEIQKNKLTPSQILAESKHASEKLEERKKHLETYFKNSLEFKEKGMEAFGKDLEKWEQAGDKVQMRMAGVSEKVNEKSYLERHVKLSSAFLEWDEKKLRGKINFQGLNTAEYKVGLGDMLPPTIRAVYVYKPGGEKIYALRARDPGTGRIGYFDSDMLKQDVYRYVPVFSGDEVEIAKTLEDSDTRVQRHILMEHIAVYKDNAMQADGGMESLYTERGEYIGQEDDINRNTQVRGNLQNLQREVTGQPESPMRYNGSFVEIEGQKLPQLTRNHMEKFWGVTEAQTSRLLAPVEFMGQRIMVNRYIIPFLIEAQARMIQRGINYKAKPGAGGCQCYNHRGIRRLDGSTSNVLSKHSWGVALDINPGQHPFGKRYEQLDPKTRMPIEFVQIMQECGFRWGNEFRNADPMHFEFVVYPPNAESILTNPDAKAAYKRVMKQSNLPRLGMAEPSLANKKETPKGALPQKAEVKRFSAEQIERKVAKYNNIIFQAAQKYNVPANLIKAVIFQESGGRPELASHAGAGGLMQLMPATAKALGVGPIYPTIPTGKRFPSHRLDPRDGRLDPRKNIMAGAKALSGLLKMYNGDLTKTLASYNWGSGNLSKYLKGQKAMPRETQNYFPSVIAMKENLDKADPRHA